MDVFYCNGEIKRGGDLRFVEFIAAQKKSDELLLVLTTPGGSPDAAYKMGRYLQARYKSFKVFVPGFCKSAGTLLAIAANELIFSPYGELGPLDIQMTRTDNLAGLNSGLNISEAFLALESRSKDTYLDLVNNIIASTGGVVSFQTASHAASEIVSSLYGPIFARIDPEEVGSRARGMRIGEDYGKRLNEKFQNLRANALTGLSQAYSSHGFVIDAREAQLLFYRVREADELEKALVEKLGVQCRFPIGDEMKIDDLTTEYNAIRQQRQTAENTNAPDPKTPSPRSSKRPAAPQPRARAKANGKDTPTAV